MIFPMWTKWNWKIYIFCTEYTSRLYKPIFFTSHFPLILGFFFPLSIDLTSATDHSHTQIKEKPKECFSLQSPISHRWLPQCLLVSPMFTETSQRAAWQCWGSHVQEEKYFPQSPHREWVARRRRLSGRTHERWSSPFPAVGKCGGREVWFFHQFRNLEN